MDSLQEIQEKLEEIRNSDFKVEEYAFYNQNLFFSLFLRDALECFNMINNSSEDKEELLSELDEIIKKNKELNPNFSEKLFLI